MADRLGRLLLRYGVAVLSSALALALMLVFGPALEPTVGQLFYFAVVVSAWYGGLGPGLLAAAWAVLALESVFVPPPGLLLWSAPRACEWLCSSGRRSRSASSMRAAGGPRPGGSRCWSVCDRSWPHVPLTRFRLGRGGRVRQG